MQVRSRNSSLPHSSVISQLSLKTKSFPRAYKVLPSLVQHCVWMRMAFCAPSTWLRKPLWLPRCSWRAPSTLHLRAFVLAVPSACNALPPTPAWFAPLLPQAPAQMLCYLRGFLWPGYIKMSATPPHHSLFPYIVFVLHITYHYLICYILSWCFLMCFVCF